MPCRPSFRLYGGAAALAALAVLAACQTTTRGARYFGKVDLPRAQVLRYVTGPEPESLDPQRGTTQSEYRIYMAFFDGLVEYDPRTIEPIPALAERWESSRQSSEFVFYLRREARWSDGAPLTAHDFVYTFRRGLSPALASRNASLAFELKYAEAYHRADVFVRDPVTGAFLAADSAEASMSPAAGHLSETSFRRSLHQPARLTLPGDERKRREMLASDPVLRAAVEGKEYVPVRAEDIGVEAIDDHTLRIVLARPAPYFLSLLPHPFFRAVPRQAIEKHGDRGWAEAGRMVSSGAFLLSRWEPYDEIVAVRNPLYWDAPAVRLEQIIFYPLEELTTAMNLYRAGELDATSNHYVPAPWADAMRPLRDYMDRPELTIQYYLINLTKPPMDDLRVRQAFNLALDKEALARFRQAAVPLKGFVPAGVFSSYRGARGQNFDPERARQLLVEAGYADSAGVYDPSRFPVTQVEIAYNNLSVNRDVAVFIQAQWQRHLKLVVPLRAMESKTFFAERDRLDYKGFARSAFGADYADPYTFLNRLAAEPNGTGWFDPRYREMLDRANAASDPTTRHEMLAAAEAYMLEAQPVIPLYTNTTSWMKKPYVKGMYPNPGSLHPWKYVYLEPDPDKWSE